MQMFKKIKRYALRFHLGPYMKWSKKWKYAILLVYCKCLVRSFYQNL